MHPRRDLVQTFLAREHRLVLRLVPFGIALGTSLSSLPSSIICAAMRRPRAQASIEPTWAWSRSSGSIDWRLILASKFMPPRGEAAGFQDFVEGERHFRHVHGELVGVPARLIVAAVDVERAEDAERRGQRDLMLERVAGKNRVVLLDIELHVLLEPVGLEQAIDRRRVIVILMLGRLLRLGLDQDRALEADLVLVVDDQREEAAGLFQFRPISVLSSVS